MMKRIFATTTFLTSTGMLFAVPAAAQQTYDLGTIVLSSSLSPVELGRTGATVEVLEGNQVGDDDTAVINRLNRLPGVSSTAKGSLGGNGAIQIRGLPARYVGVRINGIDVSDLSAVQNQFDFGGLTASGVDRIEVLKGSQSALYGSEAIGGVVNITTFTPEKLGFSGQAGVEAGSFGTYSGTLSGGYRSDRGYVALSYGRVTSDGISSQSFNTEDDGFEQTTVDLTGEYDVTDSFTLGGALHYRDNDVEIDRTAGNSSLAPPILPDISGINYLTERGARVYATFDTGAVTHTLSYSYFDIDRDDPGSSYTITFDGKRQNINYLGSAELSDRIMLNFGAERTKEEFSTRPGPSPFADPAVGASETDSAVNAELLFNTADNIDISAALRYDDNSTFGGKTTGRLAAVWRATPDLAFRAAYGTGYRAPSLYERFGQYGDASIQPEDSSSYELGVEKTLGTAGYIKATLFYTDIDDLIAYDNASTACGNSFPGCYNQVPGTTTSKGIELSGEYALTAGLSVYGAYTYTDAETDGTRLPLTPKHDVVLGLSADFTDRFSAYADLRHVADVVPFDPTSAKVGDYTLVGAGVSYAVTDNAEVYLRVENLFDEDYETVGGFNQPGRAAYVGLRASF